MINEFIESIESELRLYRRGILSAKETIDYVNMHLLVYKKQKERLSEGQPTIFYTDEKSAAGHASAEAD